MLGLSPRNYGCQRLKNVLQRTTSLFIPLEVLTRICIGLDGHFEISFLPVSTENCSTKWSVFFIDDSPHVLERVGHRMRGGGGSQLSWREMLQLHAAPLPLPMGMLILRDVYEAHEQVEGGPLKLSSTKKLSPAHVDSDLSSPDNMRVRPVA
jgi:hypothetical protein